MNKGYGRYIAVVSAIVSAAALMISCGRAPENLADSEGDKIIGAGDLVAEVVRLVDGEYAEDGERYSDGNNASVNAEAPAAENIGKIERRADESERAAYGLPVCGAAGHTADGVCPACGSAYSAPVCGAAGHTVDGVCPACGSAYPAPRYPYCGSSQPSSHHSSHHGGHC